MKTSKKVPKYQNNSSSIWFLISSIFIITLYFNTNSFDPFNTPKLIFLLISSGWLAGHVIIHIKENPPKFKSIEFIFLVTPCIFIFGQIFALFFTDVLIVGFIGETQRRNGALAYLALTIILIFTMYKINYFYIVRIIKSIIVMGVVLCGYGLLQVSGNDFVDWNNPYNAMIATVGNPNFASALLALISLVALFLFPIRSTPLVLKIIALLITVCSIFLIIDSQSKQGLLVIFFSMIFYISVYSYFNKKTLRVIVISLSFFLVTLAILGMLQIGPLTSILYKSSVTVRGYYWRAAIEMFLANPVKGIGLDRYGAFFKEFREPGYPLKYGYEITSNNAHNVFLQLFSTGGIILGLSYLLLMLLILIVGLRNISLTSGDAQKINLLLLSSWIGFQAQSLISIDNIGISIWGWLIGGCILGLNNQNSIDEDFNFKIQGIKIQKNNIRVLQPLVSTSLLIPILFLSYNLNKIETNALIVKSLANSGLSENKKIVIDHANWVIKNRFADPYYKYVMALYMVDVGYETQSHKIIMDLSQEDPRNIDNLRWLAEYEKVNQNLLREIFYREKLADLDPWNASNLLDLGRLYIKHGDARLALNVKNRIMDFAPNSDIAIVAEKELIPIE